MNIAMRYRDRIDTSLILPRVNWREPHNYRRAPTEAAIQVPTLEVVGTGKSNGGRSVARKATGKVRQAATH